MAHPSGWARRAPMLAAGILLLGRATVTYGQSHITGAVVIEADGEPVKGASVAVNPTSVTALTNSNGSFTLDLPAAARSLTVHAVGFMTADVPLVRGRTVYTVSMRRDGVLLETQIVTGIATTISAANAANAVGVVSGQDLNNVPAPTVESALQGQTVGALFEHDNGGAPGGGIQVQIRGITSFSGSTSPLYVVDGVIVDNETTDPGLGVNRASDLNPQDIASIDILKGASASTIYGSRASSGVIVVTTKKGTESKPRWSLTERVGQYRDANTLALRTFPTVGSAQAWFVHDVAHDTGSKAVTDAATIASLYAGPQNYQHTLFGNEQASYESDLSVSGTQGGTQYFASGLVKDDNGTMVNTGYSKQSVRTNVTQRLAPQLSIAANVNYLRDETRRGISGADNPALSPYGVLSTTPQFLDLDQRKPDGSWAINPFAPANPFADASEIQTPQTLSRLIGGGSVNWTVYATQHQSLQLNALGGLDRSDLHDLLVAPTSLQEERNQLLPGTAVTNHALIDYSNFAVNAIHHLMATRDLDFTTSAGFEEDNRDLTNPAMASYGLTGGSSATAGTLEELISYRAIQVDQLLYAQEQLTTLASRLTVTAGITEDRSTGNGNISKFYAYPRAAASYRLPTFAAAIDELKLRAAFGESGNPVPYPLFNPSGSSDASAQVASVLRPEAERETELGFDMTLFRSRAQLSATVYQKQISDALLDAGTTPTNHTGSAEINGGKFTNSGIELSLSTVPVQLSNGFRWTTTQTFYRNYSIVNSLPGSPVWLNGWLAPNTGASLEEGRSISQIVALNVPTLSGPLQVGDYEPSFVMTSSQEVSWKHFRLFGLLDWYRGGTVANLTDNMFDGGGGLLADTLASAKRFAAYNAGSPFAYLQPASFLKVRELSLTYELSQRWLRWTGNGRFSGASVSVEGRDLFAWYGKSYDGLDPEVSASGGQTPVRGSEIAPYPPSRSIFLSLDLHF